MNVTQNSAVKKMVGERIREARKDLGLSRTELCDMLSENRRIKFEDDSIANLSPETLKQWELGNNAVNIEWIPHLCDVLDVETGYLFGEYKEKKRDSFDMCRKTGLSERSSCILLNLNKKLEPSFFCPENPNDETSVSMADETNRGRTIFLSFLDAFISSNEAEEISSMLFRFFETWEAFQRTDTRNFWTIQKRFMDFIEKFAGIKDKKA